MSDKIEKMTDDDFKKIMQQLGMPESHSLLSALKQVENHTWQAARTVPEWISVTDRLPEQDVSFLAVTECAGDIYISTMRLPVLISKNSKPDGDFIRERVTHWMPLPAAPEPKK